MIYRILIFSALLMAPLLAAGQVAYEAERPPVNLNVGGSFSYFDANYASQKIMGIGAYAEFSPIVLDELGVEAEGHWLTMGGSNGFAEYTYLAGPRYKFNFGSSHNLHPYAKFLVGQGDIIFPHDLAAGHYFAMAPGGGVDHPLGRRLRLRADYEYQIWLNAPGIPGTPSGSMKPNGVSVGLSYRIF